MSDATKCEVCDVYLPGAGKTMCDECAEQAVPPNATELIRSLRSQLAIAVNAAHMWARREERHIVVDVERRADIARLTTERDAAIAGTRIRDTALDERSAWCPACAALVATSREVACRECGDEGTMLVSDMAATLGRIAEMVCATDLYDIGELAAHVERAIDDRDAEA